MTSVDRRPTPAGGRHRFPLNALGLLAMLAALAACGGTVGEAPLFARPAIEAQPAATAEASRDFSAAPAAVAKPEKTYPEPAALRGIDGGQLTGLLGAPKFKRRDEPAEIWQYRTESCSLDFFLYRAKGDPAYRVRHVEARGRGAAPQSEKDCLVGLIKAREQGGAG